MPAASHRVLTRLFQQDLNFTPTMADIARFERDLAVVSPSLMRDALIELSQGKSRRPAGAGQWRDAIYAIYNRKVAEHAQLFPVFHCFETAFRSRVAVTLEEHYRTAQWWAPAAGAIAGSANMNTVTRIGVIHPVMADRRRAIHLMTADMIQWKLDVMTFADGYELLEHSTLKQVKRLLSSHWPLFRHFFVNANGQPIMQAVVEGKFERVNSARNSVYHHLSFSGMTDVYTTADELLACIGFRLPPVHRAIESATCAAPPYF
jgi:hypothetical protein